MDIRANKIRNIMITPEILKLISEIDEFKGRWQVMESLAPEKLTSLRRIESESPGTVQVNELVLRNARLGWWRMALWALDDDSRVSVLKISLAIPRSTEFSRGDL